MEGFGALTVEMQLKLSMAQAAPDIREKPLHRITIRAPGKFAHEAKPHERGSAFLPDDRIPRLELGWNDQRVHRPPGHFRSPPRFFGRNREQGIRSRQKRLLIGEVLALFPEYVAKKEAHGPQ